jgi:hypothetical protein
MDRATRRIVQPPALQQRRQSLVRFCLGAPQRIPAVRGRAFVMLDGSQLAEYLNGAVVSGTEILRVFARGGFSFVLADCAARSSKPLTMQSVTSSGSTSCVSNNSITRSSKTRRALSRDASRSRLVNAHAI